MSTKHTAYRSANYTAELAAVDAALGSAHDPTQRRTNLTAIKSTLVTSYHAAFCSTKFSTDDATDSSAEWRSNVAALVCSYNAAIWSAVSTAYMPAVFGTNRTAFPATKRAAVSTAKFTAKW